MLKDLPNDELEYILEDLIWAVLDSVKNTGSTRVMQQIGSIEFDERDSITINFEFKGEVKDILEALRDYRKEKKDGKRSN